MKKIVSILLIAGLLLSLTACGGSKTESSLPPVSDNSTMDVSANIYAIAGPTGIGMVPLMDLAESSGGSLDYNFSLVTSNDDIVSKIVSGEADIAAVATNLASNLYKKTSGKITVLALNTLGVLNIVTKGEEITDIASLKGKTIYSTGQGANPEYILDYILTKNGLKIGKDVTVKFLAQNEELVTTVVKNEKAIVLAPQPIATNIIIKDEKAKIALDITKEWDKVSETSLVMGCVVVRNEFLESNEAAVKLFLKDYKKSIEQVNADIDTAASLCEKYGIVPNAAIAKKAIPNCNITYIDAKEMKTNLSAYLNILFGYSPASIGGELPDDSFYYAAH